MTPGMSPVSKDPVVSFFPYLPEDKARQELPNSVEIGRSKRLIPPVVDGVNDTVSKAVRGAHYHHYLIPDLCCVVASVE